MGVPAFYRWLSEKYPKIVEDIVEERVHLAAVGSNAPLPFDCTRPNPSGLECDNLYIDMNGIIHPCSHPENGPQPATEQEMYENVCRYVDRLFRVMRPRQMLFLAVDGVAPRAKMNQQRSRRFRSAQEARELKQLEDRVRDELSKGEGEKPPPKPAQDPWDSNVITPGTPFMLNLADYIRFYIRKRISEDKAWKNIRVIFSDASIPGEGEHKIMDHVRRQRCQPGYNPNTVHVLHGLDADLIMLALATHEAHFYISREEVLFGRKSREQQEKRQLESGFIDKQKAYDELAGPAAMEMLEENKGKPLQRISIPTLREYLQNEFASCLNPQRLPFQPSFERLIDDIVFMCFFVGNDFLPHLPSLSIRDGALDYLFNVYKRLLPSMGDYITKSGGNVNLSLVDIILAEVGAIEDYVFSMKYENDQREAERRKQQYGRNKGGRDKNAPPPFHQQQKQQPPPKKLGRAAKILEQQKMKKNNAGGIDGDDDNIVALSRGHRAKEEERQAKKAKHNMVSIMSQNDNLKAAQALKESLGLQLGLPSTSTGTADTTKEEGKEGKLADTGAGDGSSQPKVAGDDDAAAGKEEEKKAATVTDPMEEDNDEEEYLFGDGDGGDKSPPAKRKRDENCCSVPAKQGQPSSDDAAVAADDGNAAAATGGDGAEVGIVGDDVGDADEDDDDDDDDDEVEEEEPLVKVDDVVKVVEEEVIDPEAVKAFKERVKSEQQKKLDEYAKNVEDNVRLHESGWKDRYYKDKCKADDVSSHGGREHLFRSYVVGLVWVMKYYYEGCPSWKWYYPFHYAPFASDLKNIERFQKDCKALELSTPFNPVEQLMAVLPSDSAHAIPKASRWLMLDEESPIIDFYPRDVPVDPNGKAMPWLWVVLLPFIEESRLLAAMSPTMAEWTKEELYCNARGLDDGYLYVHTSHPLAWKLTNVLVKGKAAKAPKTRLTIADATAAGGSSGAAGFSGSIRPPLSNEIYPIITDGAETEIVTIPPPPTANRIDSSTYEDSIFADSIAHNDALCVAFSEPPRLSHKSVLLPGAKMQKPKLTEDDKIIRRPRLNRGGGSIASMGFTSAQGQSHQSGYGSMNISSYERQLAEKTGRGHQLHQAGTRSWGSLEPTPKRLRQQQGGPPHQLPPVHMQNPFLQQRPPAGGSAHAHLRQPQQAWQQNRSHQLQQWSSAGPHQQQQPYYQQQQQPYQQQQAYGGRGGQQYQQAHQAPPQQYPRYHQQQHQQQQQQWRGGGYQQQQRQQPYNQQGGRYQQQPPPYSQQSQQQLQQQGYNFRSFNSQPTGNRPGGGNPRGGGRPQQGAQQQQPGASRGRASADVMSNLKAQLASTLQRKNNNRRQG